MEYELVHEIKNHCPNNQMRDIFIEEVETDDGYVTLVNAKEEDGVTATMAGFCTSNPDVYKLLFDAYDQLIDKYLAEKEYRNYK